MSSLSSSSTEMTLPLGGGGWEGFWERGREVELLTVNKNF